MKNSSSEKRKLISKYDFFIIFIVLVLCAVVIFFMNRKDNDNTFAQISYDGTIVKTIDLSSAQDEIFTLKDNPKVHFQIKNSQIRFIQTECPDKLCENIGYISKANETAICLPNKVTLKIISKSSNVDIIVN